MCEIRKFHLTEEGLNHETQTQNILIASASTPPPTEGTGRTKPSGEEPTSYQKEGVISADATRRLNRKKNRIITIKVADEVLISFVGKFDDFYRNDWKPD